MSRMVPCWSGTPLGSLGGDRRRVRAAPAVPSRSPACVAVRCFLRRAALACGAVQFLINGRVGGRVREEAEIGNVRHTQRRRVHHRATRSGTSAAGEAAARAGGGTGNGHHAFGVGARGPERTQVAVPFPLLHDDAAPAPTPADSESPARPKGAVKQRGAKAAPQPTAPQKTAPEVAEAAPAPRRTAGRKAAPRAVPTSGKPEETAAGAKSAEPAQRAPKKTTAAKKTTRRAAKKTAAAKTTEPAAGKSAAAVKAAEPSAPRLADSILAYLDTAEQPVRAADVTQALGREATASSIDGIRNVLQRLVKASQAQQTGRGLYQKLPN